MQHDTFRTLWRAIDDAAREITLACRHLLRAVVAMPWPARYPGGCKRGKD